MPETETEQEKQAREAREQENQELSKSVRGYMNRRYGHNAKPMPREDELHGQEK